MKTSWLFLHGINNVPAIWTPIVEALTWASDVTTRLLPAIPNVDKIAETLWPSQGTRTLIIGHSFGGYVALAMLEKYPERVAGIVLINSHTRADNEAVCEVREQSARAAEHGEYKTLVENVRLRVYHPNNVDNPMLAQQRLEHAVHYGPERFAAHQRACAQRPDRTAMLKRFHGPKLVLASEEDLVIATDNQRSMATTCGTEFETIASAGHMLPAEQPTAVAHAIDRWWQAHT